MLGEIVVCGLSVYAFTPVSATGAVQETHTTVTYMTPVRLQCTGAAYRTQLLRGGGKHAYTAMNAGSTWLVSELPIRNISLSSYFLNTHFTGLNV